MTAALTVLVWLTLGWLAWLLIGGAVVLTWLVLAIRRALREASA